MPRRPSAGKELRSIRKSFTQLARSFGRLEPLLEAASSPEGPPPRRKLRLSAKQRQALKLQGKYMGTMRGLSPRLRGRVKKVRKEKGIRAAIAEARKLAG